MPNPVRIPRRYRGTDLQSAYLDGYEEGKEGRPPDAKAGDFCAPEMGAYLKGRDDGLRTRESLDG